MQFSIFHSAVGLAVACSAFVGAACSDFSSPAELERPQVLALRVEPAVLAPGQRGLLSALVAGPDGPVRASVDWSIERSPTRSAQLVQSDGDWWLDVDADAAVGGFTLNAAITVGDQTLLATRPIEVADSARDNPLIVAVRSDSRAVTDAGIRTEVGTTLTLDLDVDIDLSHPGAVSWYATIGSIDIFHKPTAEFVASEPGQGWLFVVCRDGSGGLDWVVVPLSIAANTGA